MKKKDIFIQEDASSCAACSVASIVSFYGGYVPLEVIREDTDTDMYGTNAFKIIETLKKYGFSSHGYKKSLEEINKDILPVIAHTTKCGYEHFLVIYDINKDYITTMDPEDGKHVYSKQEFKMIYKETIITANPIREIIHHSKSKSLLNLLNEKLMHEKKLLILVFILCLITLIINLFLSFHLKLLDLHFNPIKLTIIFMVLKVFLNILEYIKTIFIERIASYIDYSTVKDFLYHLFHLKIGTLKTRRVGEIMRKVENLDIVKELFIRIFVINPVDILTMVVSSIIMFNIHYKLTTIYFLITLISFLILILFNQFIYKVEKHFLRKYDKYAGTLVEYIDGINSIKNLNSEDKFLKKLNNSLNEYIVSRKRKDLNYVKIKLFQDNIIGIGLIYVNVVGFISLNSSFTFFDLLTLSNIYDIFINCFNSLTNTISNYLKCRAVFRSVYEFYDLPIENETPNYIEPFNHIICQNLNYSYDGFTSSFKNINCRISLGDKIFVFGPSGIGKSTFAKILAGSIDNYSGEIYLNDINIKKFSKKSLRNYVTYVSQDEKLFNASIYDNITLGINDKKRFDKLIKILKIDNIISKKIDKENAILESEAYNLSGGEKARIILARALFKNPKILIVDEILSSVSRNVEDEILKNLLKMDDISLIYISHRDKSKYFKKIIEFRKDGEYAIKY